VRTSAPQARARDRRPGFVHQAAIYGSDDQFLATAVPFIRDGLAAGEPVLAVTTSANLELLRGALGGHAHDLDYAESAYFGRRPPQRVAAFEDYWAGRRHLTPDGRVRILAEPIWSGRSGGEVDEWKLMESGLNVLLADTGIWMICPYDIRAADSAIAADARRTHPASIDRERVTSCAEFTEPATFARQRGRPWPPAPAGAVPLEATGQLRVLRRFAAAQASESGLPNQPAAMLVMAVNEVASYLRSQAGGPVSALMWAQPGAVRCELACEVRPRDGSSRAADPFAGYRSPRLSAQRPGDGLWYARQVCDRVEFRSARSAWRARLAFPAARALDAAGPAGAWVA
jgi:hypothetical protein